MSGACEWLFFFLFCFSLSLFVRVSLFSGLLAFAVFGFGFWRSSDSQTSRVGVSSARRRSTPASRPIGDGQLRQRAHANVVDGQLWQCAEAARVGDERRRLRLGAGQLWARDGQRPRRILRCALVSVAFEQATSSSSSSPLFVVCFLGGAIGAGQVPSHPSAPARAAGGGSEYGPLSRRQTAKTPSLDVVTLYGASCLAGSLPTGDAMRGELARLLSVWCKTQAHSKQALAKTQTLCAQLNKRRPAVPMQQTTQRRAAITVGASRARSRRRAIAHALGFRWRKRLVATATRHRRRRSRRQLRCVGKQQRCTKKRRDSFDRPRVRRRQARCRNSPAARRRVRTSTRSPQCRCDRATPHRRRAPRRCSCRRRLAPRGPRRCAASRRSSCRQRPAARRRASHRRRRPQCRKPVRRVCVACGVA